MDVLAQFEIHTQLNPLIWDANNNLKRSVTRRLVIIAQDFIDSLGIPVTVKDIVITGSMANYNYTKHSDIDLHIILDFDAINNNVELVDEFLLAKRSLWNDKHTIMIVDHEVEVYPENEGEVHHSTGIYSILNNDWIKQPQVKKPMESVDTYAVNTKVNNLMYKIDELLSLKEKTKLAKIESLKNKIKKMRQCGLEKNGEYSVENLAFKVLRNSGYIEKLWSGAVEEKDNMLSLQSV